MMTGIIKLINIAYSSNRTSLTFSETAQRMRRQRMSHRATRHCPINRPWSSSSPTPSSCEPCESFTRRRLGVPCGAGSFTRNTVQACGALFASCYRFSASSVSQCRVLQQGPFEAGSNHTQMSSKLPVLCLSSALVIALSDTYSRP